MNEPFRLAVGSAQQNQASVSLGIRRRFGDRTSKGRSMGTSTASTPAVSAARRRIR